MTISVVIPAYNGARFIDQAILSVLNQERRPDEIIVCDDGSSDATLSICRRYADQVSVWSNRTGPSGFVNGWNTAICRAKGEYISILHQDDLLSPAFIRLGMEALEREPSVGHLFCTCQYIDEEGVVVGSSYPDVGELRVVNYNGLGYVRAYQQQGSPHIHRCPGVITHRRIFEQCRYEPLAGHIADDDFFYRVGMYTDVLGLLQPLAAFRVHPGSVTGSMEDSTLAGQLMDDYLYQCRQWKGHSFLDAEAYGYFVRNAFKYARRYIGFGVKRGNLKMLARGVRGWMQVHTL